MMDPIERALLTALFNMLPYRAPNAKIIGVIYDSDIPQLVRDIRAGLAGEPRPEVIAEDYHPGGE